MDNDSQKTSNTSMAIIAIVATLALLGVVVVAVAVTIPLQQQAEAKVCESGIPNSYRGINASKGRCFGH
jgi:hypothetical protein